MANFIKDPDSALDFSVDWSDWLTDGETIAASSWESLDDLTIDVSTFTSSLATAWLSGGTVNTVCRLVNTITTNASPARIDQRTITISIRER